MSDTFNGGGPIAECSKAIDHYTKCLDEIDASEAKLLKDLASLRGRREHLSQMLGQWVDAKALLQQRQEVPNG
jgi:hypothetical protein